MKNGARLIKIAAAWLLVLMLAIAAAVVTIVVLNASYFSPQKPVQDYLAALSAGDGAKALGLLRAQVPASNAAVLDGPGLAASQAALKNVTVGDATSLPGDRAAVAVTYTVDDREASTTFTLQRGPRRWLFFDSWAFVPAPLPTLDVSIVNTQRATLNGVDVNMPGGKNSFAVFYPGRYSAEYKSTLFTAAPVARTVTDPAKPVPAVVLATGPSKELLSGVGQKIQGYLDGCAKQQVLMPADCPLSNVTDNRVVSPVKWSIVQYPDIAISAYGGQWVIAPLTVRAKVSYDEQNLFTGAVHPAAVTRDFSFGAKLAISGTTVTVTPQVSY
ncbi:hypothetical protein [Specibacter cremeus]|uniref:hypothetical protein n=1 Tax=Specibacter cremeus TaxID=1629051 RepID=UPI000F7934DA|nr:hypothetical protein [Specibacter cremeus]